jgi:hypothetical protein
VTTYHAPAALNVGKSISRARTIAALAVTLFALGLAGCESSNALFGSAAPATPETQLTQPAAPLPPPTAQTRVAIAPVIGAPDAVGRQLQQEFGSAVAKQKATVVGSGDKSDYTLRGYIVAAKDRAGTKVSYIWDVTDPSSKRLNRITGEEIIPGTSAAKDPWTAVTPQVMQAIAQKSAASFGSWLSTNQPTQAAIAAAPAAATPSGVGATGSPAQIATAATTPPPAARPAPATPVPTQASYQQPAAAGLTAIVPSVTGAPGDGSLSLTQALQGELSRSGVAIGQPNSTTSYRVEGVVRMGQSRDGKQPISIDWNVKDPQGKKLGTVSQKNEIQEGSLDGPWGKTADAAAAAAAQGILKLLPQKN